MALKTAVLGAEFEEPMEGLRLQSGRLGQAFGGASGRRARQNRDAVGAQNPQEAVDNRGFAHAGTARHDRQFAGEGGAHGNARRRRARAGGPGLAPGDRLLDVDP